MVSVEQANEIVAKMRELETEQNLIKDLFNSALRMSQSSGEEKLNFRHTERYMPGMFNSKAAEYTESYSRWETYMSTLDPARKGGEILRAAATEVKDMDDAEVRISQRSTGTCLHSTARWHHPLSPRPQAKLARLFVECCRHFRDLASERGKS